MAETPKDVLALAKDSGVKIVDLRFCDLPGLMQHFSMPVSELTEDSFADGFGFDGSSIRGFQAIHESDMLLMPDPTTAVLDPFREVPTLLLNCFIEDPITRQSYSRDPRYIAKKAQERLIATGIADTSYWGPELEFYIFDEARFDQNQHEGCTAGQSEIDMRFSPLLAMADKVMTYKYVVKNTAWKHGKTATFMPKPLFGDNGSGMHVHSSLWKDGQPLFFDAAGYGGLSETARHYVGGMLLHAPALLAFCAPTTNSYRRLVPGYEAPINLVYSQRNRSACVRIPMYSNNPKAKRIEFRCPDPSANPYLAFSAMLMAGLDGIRNRIEPAAPIDKDLYELPPEEALAIPQVPGSLDKVLDTLEADHDYLVDGGVFTPDLIETWLDYKRSNELDPIRLRPHPHEFELYFDV